MRSVLAAAVGLSIAAIVRGEIADDKNALPVFELVQQDLFAASGGQPNAWADFNNDGQLDEFVGFRGRPNRLYEQDHGRFHDVAAAVGIADNVETRVAAWGDFDGDGHIDLYVGFAGAAPNRLYRNDGNGRHFTDVAPALGLALTGVTRQAVWVDYDNDGDLDLFVAFRDGPNRLFRNDGGHFTDVTKETGMGDPRKTVGAVWFDIDGDGDLDVFVANQEGDANGLFRNDINGRPTADARSTSDTMFVDVAKEWGVDAAGRPKEWGGVGPAVADFDGDGLIDLFVANYGPSALYRNDRGRRFVDMTRAAGVFFEQHATTPAWGDYDNDGRPDLYVAGFLATEPHYPDHLFHNDGGRFHDVMPALIRDHDASHGVQWVDFDNDGALDLALTNNDAAGGHYLFRNRLPADQARRSLSVDVVDTRGRHTKPGAEVRVFRAGSRTLISSGLVDSGSGYCSQNVMPVHVATAGAARVDIEVTTMSRSGRRLTKVSGVDPMKAARPLVVKTPDI
ncbi:MAG TPA: VCBS repeat-containing protein [Vicinamibacterales bacterium]